MRARTFGWAGGRNSSEENVPSTLGHVRFCKNSSLFLGEMESVFLYTEGSFNMWVYLGRNGLFYNPLHQDIPNLNGSYAVHAAVAGKNIKAMKLLTGDKNIHTSKDVWGPQSLDQKLESNGMTKSKSWIN